MNSTVNTRSRILLTGGPGTGKTTLINELAARGYPCYPEEIRLLTRELLGGNAPAEGGENPLQVAADPLEFNRRLLGRRLKQWLDFDRQPAPMAFYDRGIPDVLAYMDVFGQPYPPDFTEAALDYRYDLVFLTPVWPEIYEKDPERLESIDLAYTAEQALLDVYQRYGYRPVIIPPAPPGERADFVIHYLKSASDGTDYSPTPQGE